MNKLPTVIYQLQTQRGFIALMSAIVISVLLLAITVSLGFSGFFTRFNILDSEDKERSLALAEACIDTAILKLSQDPGYNPTNECNSVGDTCPNSSPNANVCTVVSVLSPTASGKITIKTQASINKAYTNLRVIIDNSAFTICSWDECQNLTDCGTVISSCL